VKLLFPKPIKAEYFQIIIAQQPLIKPVFMAIQAANLLRFRKQDFWENPLWFWFNFSKYIDNFILNPNEMVSSTAEVLPVLPKKEDAMRQRCLVPPESIPPRAKYEKLFENLPKIPLKQCQCGRPPVSRQALLKALIYRNLRGISKLIELEFELANNPSIAEPLGLDPLKKTPSDERFSNFLRSTPNEYLQTLRKSLVQQLADEEVIAAKGIGFDSCPIEAMVKQNNLKTSIKDRYDKDRLPSGDKDARLGVTIHFPTPFRRKIHYFWGYRNHIINDLKSELPICELSLPANKSEKPVGLSLLKELNQDFDFPVEVVVGDANYDAEEILEYIIHEMKAEAVIPRNPGNTQNTPYTVKKGKIFCQAELPMYRKGKMTVKDITYCQYSCPLYWSKAFRGQYLLCPAGHPKFLNQKGCNVLIRLNSSIREKINYGTQRFKKVYSQRTSVERAFSRLLAISMQHPTIKGLPAIRNHCTIAHITVLVVALTAHRLGYKDHIRFVKSFVPNFLTR
jgi:hypothetical protein